MRFLNVVAVAAVLGGCRVLPTGLDTTGRSTSANDAPPFDLGDTAGDVVAPAIDGGEPAGISGAPLAVGCSDGTREGFRDVEHWPSIAGCAGAFDQPGVVPAADLLPVCALEAGDTSTNPAGTGCSAADLCAEHWHVCRNAAEVALRSPTGCESCVPAGELRFFIVAAGASTMGICSPDPQAANDLHGCGGYGEAESSGCAPLTRRMGFANCLDSDGAWWCGTQADGTREAAVVTKTQTIHGGVLCCRD